MILREVQRIRQYAAYRGVFLTHRDVQLYRAVRDRPDSCPSEVVLRARAIGGHPLVVRRHTMDAITLWDALFHRYHLPRRRMACRTIVSLGANAGYTTAHLAHTYPEARIVAVEMDAANAAVCRRNTAPFQDRCAIVHAAIWCSDGGEVAYRGADVHDLRVAALDGVPSVGLATAPALTLDTLFEQYALGQVDFVKMDIEGAESVALAGSMRWARCVNAVLVEVHPPASLRGCADALRGAGFDCESYAVPIETVFAFRPARIP